MYVRESVWKETEERSIKLDCNLLYKIVINAASS